MTSLYLIRHAQAQGNVEQRFQGRIDLPLTSLGEQQVAALVRRLSTLTLDRVYTSPLQRACNTARPVAESHHLPLTACDGLMEIDGGAFENRKLEELERDYPWEIQLFFHQPHRFAGVGGGESWAALRDRITGQIAQLVQQHRGETLAVVSHGAAIRTYLCHCMGYDLSRLEDVPWVPNTGVSHILFDEDDVPSLQYTGDDSHLADGENNSAEEPVHEDTGR